MIKRNCPFGTSFVCDRVAIGPIEQPVLRTLLQHDAAREFDRVTCHGVATGRRRFLVASPDGLRQIGMQTGDLVEVAEAIAMDVEETARKRMQR